MNPFKSAPAMRNCLVVVMLLTSKAVAADRFWYDATCRRRALASLDDYFDRHVFLQVTGGQSICVPFDRLAASDLLYLDAVEDAVKAALHVSGASYPVPDEERYLSQLIEENHLDVATVRALADLPPFNARAFADRKRDDIDEWDSRQRDGESTRRAFARRKLEDIQTRWVAIDRIQYKVARADVANNGTGLTSLTVRTNRGEVAVNPADVGGSVSVLPIFWDQQIFAPGLAPALRKKNLERVYSRGHVWEYQLVYSEIASMWTDPEIAAAYERIASSQERFDRWPYQNQLSEAAWNFHRANSIVTRAIGVDWEQSFPWLDGDWGRHEQLSLALDHYTRSLELVPHWGEALLRRAAVSEAMQHFVSAIDHLEDFRALPNFMPRLPITGRSADYLSHHADVVQARISSQLGDHYKAIQLGQHAIDVEIDVARTAELAINVVGLADADAIFWAATPPGPTLEMHIDAAVAALRSATNISPDADQKNKAVLLLNGILTKGTNHFLAERDLAFKKNALSDALLAAKTSAKYSTPKLRDPVDVVPVDIKNISVGRIELSKTSFGRRRFYKAMTDAKRAWKDHPTDEARAQYDDCLKAHTSVTFGLGL
jgi:hypothetical protein